MNKLNAIQLAALTSNEITNSAEALKSLIETTSCGIDFGDLETFQEHEMHTPAAQKLTEWAKSILGRNFHLSISYQGNEGEGMFRIFINEEATLTSEIDEKVKQFSEAIFAAGEDGMTFYWSMKVPDGPESYTRSYLTLAKGYMAMFSAELADPSGRSRPLFDEKISGDTAWRIFREAHPKR